MAWQNNGKGKQRAFRYAGDARLLLSTVTSLILFGCRYANMMK